jgi:hypothetical protein
MTCSNENCDRSRRPGAVDRGWSDRSDTRWLGDREVGWRCVRSTPYTWRRVARVSWLSLKTKGYSLSVIWPQNHWDSFLWFGLKTGGDSFLDWASKPTVTVWWFRSQNHCDYFLVWASKLNGLRSVGCATKRTKVGRCEIRVKIWRLASAGCKSR